LIARGLSKWNSQYFNWTNKNHLGGSSTFKSSCWSTVRQKVLSKEQARICIKHPHMMSIIREAAKITRTTCHNAFADHRWNCSSIDVIPRQTPDLTQGSREQAWVHALSSATLTRSVARGCSSGSLKNCACGSFPRHPPDGQFKWGGCGDNIQFAKKFAKCFSDVHYKKLVKKGEKITNYYATNEWKLPHVIAATNIHNNRAGRKAVEQSLHIQCKCHGVSGSCSVKTCWRSLPAIDEIANRLKVISQLN